MADAQELLWLTLEATEAVCQQAQERGSFTKADLLKLRLYFGPTLDKALPLIDTPGAIIRVACAAASRDEAGRLLFQVRGAAGQLYTCLPFHHCSCQSWYTTVIGRRELWCKHILAARMATALNACVDETVEIAEFNRRSAAPPIV